MPCGTKKPYQASVSKPGYNDAIVGTSGIAFERCAVVTASGLLIIGASDFDRKMHAFESKTGKLLWEAELPYAGNATPITYMAGGRQYVLIQADNARDRKSPQGAAYVAFALPAKDR